MLGCLLLLLFSLSSIATDYQDLSSLEKQVVDEGLNLHNLKPLNFPHNKIVRNIYFITASPFFLKERGMWFLNALHINTKDSVIKREIQQQTGEFFSEQKLKRSEILLRSYNKIRSVAVIMPVKSAEHAKNEIGLLVATRDLLSLRPNIGFNGSFNKLDYLSLTLGEHNIAGYNKSLFMHYDLDKASHRFSIKYFDPNIFSSSWQFSITPGIIFARDSFKYKGLLFDMGVNKTINRNGLSYGLNLGYALIPIIEFKGNSIRKYNFTDNGRTVSIDRKYMRSKAHGSIFGNYEMGNDNRKNLFFSYNLKIKKTSIDEDLKLTTNGKAKFIKEFLPKSETESYLNAGFSYYRNNYLSLYDYDNFKLQETVSTGPYLKLSADISIKELMFGEHNFIRPKAMLSFTQPIYRDSFIRLKLSGSSRYSGILQNNIVRASCLLVSPKIFGLGRVIARNNFFAIEKARDDQKFILGNESGLRGAISDEYEGSKGFIANLEFRSAPIDLWIFQTGAVAFYDAGGAFDNLSKARSNHSIGMGIRMLMPQVSSVIFRFDLAYVLHGQRRNSFVPSFGTEQAF